MNTTIIYFSPTGGTRLVAEAIADHLGCTALDVTVSASPMCFTSEDLVFLCFPVYGGRVPSPMLERLRWLQGDHTPAVPVATFGNRAVDDALLEMKDLLKQHGFYTAAGCEMVTPHSIDTRFGSGRPDAQDLSDLCRFLDKVLAKDRLPEIDLPGNPDYMAYGGLPFKPVASKKCIRCGKCAENCPAGAIPMSDPKKTDNTLCITCMRCVDLCPTGARHVPKPMQILASTVLKKYCSGRKEPRFYL